MGIKDSTFKDFCILVSYQLRETDVDEMKQFYLLLLQSLLIVHRFRLDNLLSEMLYHTDNDIKRRHLPFDNIYIDTKFVFDEQYDVNGIAVQTKGENVYATVCLVDKFDNDKFGLLNFSLFEDLTKADHSETRGDKFYKISYTKERLNQHKKFQMYINNILDFLYSKDVELVTVEYSKEHNLNRLKRQKLINPSTTSILLKGKLKIYLDRLRNKVDFDYNHRFWVRGHFRVLRDDRWKKSKGKKIWIYPFIKGKGVLHKKEYIVKNGD